MASHMARGYRLDVSYSRKLPAPQETTTQLMIQTEHKNQIHTSLLSTATTERVGLKTACRKSKGTDYRLLAFCQSVPDALAVLGFEVYLGEAGQDGAHCRLGGLPEYSRPNSLPNSLPQHTKRQAKQR